MNKNNNSNNFDEISSNESSSGYENDSNDIDLSGNSGNILRITS